MIAGIARNRRNLFLLAIGVLLILGDTGEAKRKGCEICRRGDPVRTFIDPKYCRDLPDGRFTCDHVVFDPLTVNLKESSPKNPCSDRDPSPR